MRFLFSLLYSLRGGLYNEKISRLQTTYVVYIQYYQLRRHVDRLQRDSIHKMKDVRESKKKKGNFSLLKRDIGSPEEDG